MHTSWQSISKIKSLNNQKPPDMKQKKMFKRYVLHKKKTYHSKAIDIRFLSNFTRVRDFRSSVATNPCSCSHRAQKLCKAKVRDTGLHVPIE